MSLVGILRLNHKGDDKEEEEEVEEEENDFAVILNGSRTFILKKRIALKINYFCEHILNSGSYICFINCKLNVGFA
jgi:hypothetical protein